VAGLSCRQRGVIVFLDTDAWVFVSGASITVSFCRVIALLFCSVRGARLLSAGLSVRVL